MRLTLALSLAASLAVADPANAVLRHYDVRWATISQFNTQNPAVNSFPPSVHSGPSPVGSRGIVDDQNSGSPVLKKLILINDSHQTTCCVGFDHYVFISQHAEEGPRKGLAFTGTGNVSSMIAWGLVTGWTITGGVWCNSDWLFICTYVGAPLATVDPKLLSPFYDLGTWTFHGTGFTTVPFVRQVPAPPSTAVGNNQYHLRGRLAAGLVPAVPILGVALLGAGLLVAGARLSL